jgi:secondary thiamine-phosphate synthase enzyme
MAGVFSQHTTAMLIVNEFQEALLDDIHAFLRRVVEEERDYKHNSPEFSDCDRHNATSHLRSLIFSNNVVLPVSSGELVLGRYQSVILAELDGPRERNVKVQLMGE